MSDNTVLQRGKRKEIITKIVRDRNIAISGLTENKFVECLMQAIECGDFQSCMSSDGEYFGMSYIPYRRVFELEQRIRELEKNQEEK